MGKKPPVDFLSIVADVAKDVIGDELVHRYAIAPLNDGNWGVFCTVCSSKAGDYRYPCAEPRQVGAPLPSKVMVPIGKHVMLENQLEAAGTVLGMLASILELPEDDNGQVIGGSDAIIGRVDRIHEYYKAHAVEVEQLDAKDERDGIA